MKKILPVLFLAVIFSFLLAGFQNVNASTAFNKNLYFGMTVNSDVTNLQTFLTGQKIYSGPVNGNFFSLTQKAVKQFQISQNINPAVGYFGPLTRAKANSIVANQDATVQTQAISAGSLQSELNTLIIQLQLLQNQQVQQQAATTTATVATSSNGSPMRLIIPKLNVNAGFQYNGLNSDGVMEIPSNIVDVGWFTGSPHPGEIGAAIITGHVAQIRRGIMTKPGVFYNLNELSPGDKIYITNDKGEIFTFVVRESRSYDPTADATDVFTSADSGVHLNIITCEGTWNQDQLSYSQRLVVFTDLW